MLRNKLSSLLLIFLILNLNMVVPVVSYASAEETCSCHIGSGDRQCHCEHHHNKGDAGVKSQNGCMDREVVIKGWGCSSSRGEEKGLPILGLPFIFNPSQIVIALLQSASQQNPVENPLHGLNPSPSEKPPAF